MYPRLTTFLVLLPVACSDATTRVSAITTTDASVADAMSVAPSRGCARDLDCDDGRFCNGIERCRPGAPNTSVLGCLPGTPPCEAPHTCEESTARCVATTCDAIDSDGDRVPASACGGADCDDADPARYPGNAETCDVRTSSHDEDCNPCTVASITSGDGDLDHDGFLASSCTNVFQGTAPSCNPSLVRVDERMGRVTGLDCNDADPNVRPNQVEACNGRDDNCNGEVDEGVAMRVFYPDRDGDGYGDRAAAPVRSCVPPSGYVENGNDCDDTSRLTNPAATELCDSLDNNCDGRADEAGPRVFYRDADGDGRGDPVYTVSTTSCRAPDGFVSVAEDCNDGSPQVYRGAPERCDGLDDDCSLPGTAAGGRDVTEDFDGDTHSRPDALCNAGPFPKDDCDDRAANTYSGAPERCDGVDNNCSMGSAAGGVDPAEDRDRDGHASVTATCSGGPFPHDDCDDASMTTHPGAQELCNRIDDDCSLVGAAAGGRDTNEDRDEDGHASVSAGCVGGLPRDDCGDDSAGVFPGAAERCDGVDNDCDGVVDEAPDADTGCSVGERCVNGACSAVRSVASGLDFTCAVMGSGATACWGLNAQGQLGDGTTTSRALPTSIAGLPPSTSVACSAAFACVLGEDGVVRCWGVNSAGQLGDGSTASRRRPATVTDLRDAVEIAAGDAFACARRAGGQIACWGENANGQLGDATTSGRLTPVAAVGLSNATAVAAGATHACAVTTGGAVFCWGNNTNGQLGDASVLRRVIPTAVVGVSNAVSVACGTTHTCAALRDGTAWCWGRNDTGQLGNGGRTDSRVPVQVAMLTDAVQVAASDGFSCARRSNGAIVCWGDNGAGQLGDGTFVRRLIPTPVAPVLDAAALTLGSRHACTRRRAGQVLCWGDNRAGALGDGTLVDHATPAAVRFAP